MDVLMSFSIRNVSGIFIATDDKREAMHIAYETNSLRESIEMERERERERKRNYIETIHFIFVKFALYVIMCGSMCE